MAEKYRFERLTLPYYEIVLSWLYEPHMQEFWDNSQDHKDDILNFVNGRKSLSTYFNGIFTYWLGFIENNPFAFFLTAAVKKDTSLPHLRAENLSKTGTTYSIDFAIGGPAPILVKSYQMSAATTSYSISGIIFCISKWKIPNRFRCSVQ